MLDTLESIIGFTYTDNPELFIICTFIVLWFIYQLWTFIYYLFGVNK